MLCIAVARYASEQSYIDLIYIYDDTRHEVYDGDTEEPGTVSVQLVRMLKER